MRPALSTPTRKPRTYLRRMGSSRWCSIANCAASPRPFRSTRSPDPKFAAAYRMRPPAGRGGPPRIVYFYLSVIVVSWAANLPMMKLALGDAPPRGLVLLLSAMTWALGSCLYRRRIWRTPFWTQTFWQLAVSGPVVIVFALPQIGGEPIHWSPTLFAILAYNWVVTTALGYFLWAVVLTAMPAAAAGQVLALTPVGGFLISTAIFGGAVTADVIGGSARSVAGVRR